MSENLYCGPCRRLLAGHISLIDEDRWFIEFHHHDTFESFDAAMRLPCSICNLTWKHTENVPSAQTWSALRGYYMMDRETGKQRTLVFKSDDDIATFRSHRLALIPWAGECHYTPEHTDTNGVYWCKRDHVLEWAFVEQSIRIDFELPDQEIPALPWVTCAMQSSKAFVPQHISFKAFRYWLWSAEFSHSLQYWKASQPRLCMSLSLLGRHETLCTQWNNTR